MTGRLRQDILIDKIPKLSNFFNTISSIKENKGKFYQYIANNTADILQTGICVIWVKEKGNLMHILGAVGVKDIERSFYLNKPSILRKIINNQNVAIINNKECHSLFPIPPNTCLLARVIPVQKKPTAIIGVCIETDTSKQSIYKDILNIIANESSLILENFELSEATNKGLQARLDELNALYDVSISVSSKHTLESVLEDVTKKAAKIMNADVSSLRLLDITGRYLLLKYSFGMESLDCARRKKLKLGESIAGRSLQNRRYYVVDDLYREPRYKMPQFARRKRLHSLLSVPIYEGGNPIGVISIYGKNKAQFNEESAKLLTLFANQAAVAIENAKLFESMQSNYLNTIRMLADITDAKDGYTRGHSERVMHFTTLIANQMGLDEEKKEPLRYASLLHDIGKIGIDNNILRKTGTLTEEEWVRVQSHPELGAGIVDKTGFLDKLCPMILHHHARFSGGGYPDTKMNGDSIPLGARIIAVADAYEAMTSERPYRASISKEEAIEEIKRCAGEQFDPEVVQAFLKVIHLILSTKKV